MSTDEAHGGDLPKTLAPHPFHIDHSILHDQKNSEHHLYELDPTENLERTGRGKGTAVTAQLHSETPLLGALT